MNPDHYQIESFVNPARGHGEISVLFSGEGRPRESHGIGPAVHSYYLMHTVLSGTGEYTLRGKRYICSAGDTFLIFPGELFRYEADAKEPWHYVWVAFYGHMSDPLLQQLGITPETPVVENGAVRRLAVLYRKLRRCLQLAELPALADLKSAGLLRLLFHELALTNVARLPASQADVPPARRQVEQAVRWLELQYNQPISIDQLAKSLGYHRTHLSKLFKEHIGMSPMQFLMKIRLDRAKMLLKNRWTIEQVASSVGFADPLYFSKQFRKKYGMSPSEYRNQS